MVMQEDTNGCGLACIATIVNQPYQSLKRHFHNNFEDTGISLEGVMDYLGDAGFSLVYKAIRNYAKIDFALDELLKPFAPIHVVRIQDKFDTEMGHFIIMDSKGKLYCPQGSSEAYLKKAYAITDVVGVYPLDFLKK